MLECFSDLEASEHTRWSSLLSRKSKGPVSKFIRKQKIKQLDGSACVQAFQG